MATEPPLAVLVAIGGYLRSKATCDNAETGTAQQYRISTYSAGFKFRGICLEEVVFNFCGINYT